MYNANANRITASKLIQRAEEIADITNTDFLSYNEKLEYLNSTWKDVYQKIINYNLNVFTVDANLVGAAGRYKLPFDCYQIKSVKNPYTGRMIPRKADSESALGGYYEIVNDEIVLGPTVGPVVVTYWRKPFWLSVPNKPISTQFDFSKYEILSSCKNSVLIKDKIVGAEQKLYVQNLLTESTLELPITYDNTYTYVLGNNYVLEYKIGPGNPTYHFEEKVYDFFGNTIIDYNYNDTGNSPDIISSDNGIIYWGVADTEDNKLYITQLGNEEDDPIEIDLPEDVEDFASVICIEDNFYFIKDENPFPIGIFDDRPAYITDKKELHLINPNGSEIVEKIDIPTIGQVYCTSYGYLTFDGTLYSCIPDTLLDFPNNLYYDVISYDLAVRFLCKQNADSSGVENLNANAWRLLVNSIDQNADYPRVKLVRR